MELVHLTKEAVDDHLEDPRAVLKQCRVTMHEAHLLTFVADAKKNKEV